MGRELRENGEGFAVCETVTDDNVEITPTFKTKEELVEHLVTKGTAWDAPWTREQAEHFMKKAYAPSFVLYGNGTVAKGYTVTDDKK